MSLFLGITISVFNCTVLTSPLPLYPSPFSSSSFQPSISTPIDDLSGCTFGFSLPVGSSVLFAHRGLPIPEAEKQLKIKEKEKGKEQETEMDKVNAKIENTEERNKDHITFADINRANHCTILSEQH